MSSFPKPHREERSIEEIEIFELITRVIPHHEVNTLTRIAHLYGCSEQLVRKWRNDPKADSKKKADPHGRRSPVDNLLQFLDALNAVDPARVEIVWTRLEYEYARMQQIQGKDGRMRKWEALKKANSLARELVAVTDTDGEPDG